MKRDPAEINPISWLLLNNCLVVAEISLWFSVNVQIPWWCRLKWNPSSEPSAWMLFDFLVNGSCINPISKHSSNRFSRLVLILSWQLLNGLERYLQDVTAETLLHSWRLLLCVTLSKQRECWKLRDSRLNSEFDSRVHGQPSIFTV